MKNEKGSAPASDAAEKSSRREALKRMGKFAVVTAPVVMAALKTKAAAAVPCGGP